MDTHGGFCIGDFVAAVKDNIDGNRRIKSGMTGVVVDICKESYPSVGVRWDEDVGGHTCIGHCPEGFGWYVTPEDIVPVEHTIEDILEMEFFNLLKSE